MRRPVPEVVLKIQRLIMEGMETAEAWRDYSVLNWFGLHVPEWVWMCQERSVRLVAMKVCSSAAGDIDTALSILLFQQSRRILVFGNHWYAQERMRFLPSFLAP